MEEFSFEKLIAYKESRMLVVEVYKIIAKLPSNERYAIGPQLQRSIVSVNSNIAEGSGRISYKEKIHFIEIAFGSLYEAYSQLQLCVDLNYLLDSH
ncbi:MAG: four helix bundle protein [Muribaculum sp.]|nr:four helix bundle protein [Muribaculum sp.]